MIDRGDEDGLQFWLTRRYYPSVSPGRKRMGVMPGLILPPGGLDLGGPLFIPSSQVNLLNGLISFWKLEEATAATRNDSVGTNNLADNLSVAQVTGKLGFGAGFTAASSQFLSIADNASLSLGTDQAFTWAFWYNPTTNNTTQGIIQKWSNFSSNPTSEYGFYLFSSQLILTVGNGTISASASTAPPSNGSWHFIVGWYDRAGQTVNIQVDNGTIVSTSWTGGTQDSAAALWFGKTNFGDFLNGSLDAVGFWKRTLTTAERTFLWNSGAGREYPFT